MIELYNGYYIDMDSYNYTAKRRFAGRTKDGEEKESYTTVGFYTTLQSAITGCAEDMARRELMDGQHDLHMACKIVVKVYTEMTNFLRNNLPEFEVVRKS